MVGIILAGGGSLLGAAEVADRIVAIVNEEAITQSELDRSVQPLMMEAGEEITDEEFLQLLAEAEQEALERLVTERLIVQEAKRQQIRVNEAEVEKEIQELRAQYGSESGFLNALQQQGLTLERLRERIRERMIVRHLIQREVREKTVVSPKEVMEYYVQHPDQFVAPEQRQVQHLLIRVTDKRPASEALTIAHKVLQELHHGTPFEELAKQYSDVNAQTGGELGAVERGQLMKELDEAIFQLEPGKHSGVIQSAVGCHVVKVGQIIPKRERKVEEVWGRIELRLAELRFQQRFREWLEKLKGRAYIARP